MKEESNAMNSNILHDETNLNPNLATYILHKCADFFRNPKLFYKNLKPTNHGFIDLILALISLLIPFIAALLAGLGVIYRKYYYSGEQDLFGSDMWSNFGYVFGALSIITLVPYIVLFVQNQIIYKKNFFHILFFTIRESSFLWFPFLIGFLGLFIAQLIQPVWILDRLVVLYIVVMHFSLIWYIINLYYLFYSSKKTNKHIVVLLIIYFLIIIGAELILAHRFNDIAWENPTIFAMWRQWIYEVFY